MTISMEIDLDSKEAQILIDELLRFMSPTDILKTIGLRQKSWVLRNFKLRGRLNKIWPELSEGTIESRRRRSSAPLQDTGHLRRSFEMEIFGADSVEVGTNIEYAKFHEEGTRPFIIRAKSKKALTIPHPLGPRDFKKGKLRGKSGFFAQSVNHPGIPARPMLPSKKIAEKLAVQMIEARLKKVRS